MIAHETQVPPLAQALGRLRQPRAWPYAARPAEIAPPIPRTPAATPACPDNDFLCILPEPALTGELPAPKPAPSPTPNATAERDTLTAVEALALAPVNRTYWFDL